MFEQELELVRIAFKTRQADAYERADRLRTRIMASMLDLKQRILADLGGTGSKAKPLDKETRIGRLQDLQRRLEACREARPIDDALQILDGIEKQYGNKSTLDRQGGETPEQLLQAIGGSRYSDPVLRLMAQGHLTVEQTLAAREIERVCRFVVRGAKTTYFPVGPSEYPEEGKLGRLEAFRLSMQYDEFMSLLHGYVYLAWSDQVGKLNLDLVFGLCVEGRSIDELRKLHRLGWKSVLHCVRGALDDYNKLRADFNPERPVKQPRTPPAGSALPLKRKA